jgi:hypothetical protein
MNVKNFQEFITENLRGLELEETIQAIYHSIQEWDMDEELEPNVKTHYILAVDSPGTNTNRQLSFSKYLKPEGEFYLSLQELEDKVVGELAYNTNKNYTDNFLLSHEWFDKFWTLACTKEKITVT